MKALIVREMAFRDQIAHADVDRLVEEVRRSRGCAGGHGRAARPPQAELQGAVAMAIRLEKPWIELTPEAVKALPGQLGVYQLADAEGRVVYIGFAGGRSLFGLRSELERALKERPAGAARFRTRSTSNTRSRYQELLMLHVADYG